MPNTIITNTKIYMKFCKRCLYTTAHPLGLTIDEEGICSGCRVHEEKDTLDWNYRFSILENIVSDYRSKNGENYDCIVPVTGANDSYFIVDIVKNKTTLKTYIYFFFCLICSLFIIAFGL